MIEDDASVIEADASVIGADASVIGDDASVPATDAGTPVADAGQDAGSTDVCASVDCRSLDTACTIGICNPTNATCRSEPRPNGTTCDDGDRCTTGDACMGGTCRGTALDCSSLDGICTRGTCNAATGACVATTAADGTSCDADASDCVTQTCRSGVCGAAPATDCTTCGGGVCAAGMCSAAPDTLHYGFESGLPVGWTVGGNAGWTVDSSRAFAGTMAAHSGAIGNNATSWLRATFTVRTPSMVTFRLSTSTEGGADWLLVLLDGVEMWGWSGDTAWSQGAIAMGPGTHTVEWRYEKDVTIASGQDRVWIDEVRVEHLQPTADFESGTMPRVFQTTAATGWVVDGSSVHGGAFAARSGAIGHNGVSRLSRFVHLETAGELSFWLRTSTESGYDELRLYVDNTLRGRWSGETAWTRAAVALTAGAHTIEWAYVKDESISHGSDRVWIDDVVTGEQAGSGGICGP